ncbi:hypothetical protein B0H14DRAFT_2643329 [Mycena olivaceomarginata]|nr:hypothetical protein B0H14DRAFT_2643329 [Mycena olivaceomarginata]
MHPIESVADVELRAVAEFRVLPTQPRVGAVSRDGLLLAAVPGEEGAAAEGVCAFDGRELAVGQERAGDLDYKYSSVGDLPQYLPTLAFPPSYFHRVIRTGPASTNPRGTTARRREGIEHRSGKQRVQAAGSVCTGGRQRARVGWGSSAQGAAIEHISIGYCGHEKRHGGRIMSVRAAQGYRQLTRGQRAASARAAGSGQQTPGVASNEPSARVVGSEPRGQQATSARSVGGERRGDGQWTASTGVAGSEREGGGYRAQGCG